MKSEFLRHLIEISGPDHVLSSPDAIKYYSRCTIPWSKTCGAVVLPENADQVSRIVRLCNEYSIPLWAFSRGHNWGYGTVLALQTGALIVILEKMKQIHEVNEELCYAVIEPGVSQGQLNEYLKKKGSNLWIDCTDSSPDGSLIGNALDKGVGYTPYGDHFGHLCGMEVVLSDGQIMTTGGVSSDCPTRYTYKWGVGPFVDGLFAQSNLGIVTKAGLLLMPKPEMFEMFVMEVSDAKHLAAVVDALRELSLLRIIHNCHGFNEFLVLARTFGYPHHLLRGKPYLDDHDIEQWATEQGLCPWTFVGGLYGSARQVKADKAELRLRLSHFGRLSFIGDRLQNFLKRMALGARGQGIPSFFYRALKSVCDLFVRKMSTEIVQSFLSLYPILKGEPGEDVLALAYFKNKERQPRENLDPVRDECGLIWFAPILPARGSEIQGFVNDVKGICLRNRLETAVLLIQSNPRTSIVLIPLFYDKKNADESGRAQTTYDELCDLLTTCKYEQYRCSTPQMERILNSNPSYKHLMKAIKKALDPNGIIAPGRYGI
jgi:4-cresol dehydrogenase (hydroxylating) flavoprotein subunit